MRISDWSSDVCSSDLEDARRQQFGDAKPHRKDQPQPPRLADECAQVHWVSGSNGPRLRGAGAGGDVGAWVPSASLASSPIPPSVPINWVASTRSEEHTSELQSLMRISYAVFCLQTT